MELKQFISKALLNIVNGVEDANSKQHNRFRIIGVYHGQTQAEGAYAEFDVSVVVQNSSSGKIGGKVGANILNVVSANIGSEIDKNSLFQNAHRLKFQIFICEKKGST